MRAERLLSFEWFRGHRNVRTCPHSQAHTHTHKRKFCSRVWPFALEFCGGMIAVPLKAEQSWFHAKIGRADTCPVEPLVEWGLGGIAPFTVKT